MASESGREGTGGSAGDSSARRQEGTGTSRSGTAAWAAAGWLAAAVCLVVAVASWIVPTRDPAGTNAPAAARRSLIADAPDLVRIAWQPGPHEAGAEVEGDVVWSPARQEGFMRFRGLPTNDPTREQYQLWIFDAERNEAHPVDGGVFDVPSEVAEVVIPIDAKLFVNEVNLFAITIEPPGGVVVSDRSRLPLLAPVEKGSS